MSWHVGGDDRGGLLHYSCGVAGRGDDGGGGGVARGWGIVKEEWEELGRSWDT